MRYLISALLFALMAARAIALPVGAANSGDDMRITTSLPNEDNVSFTFWIQRNATNDTVVQYMMTTNDGTGAAIVRSALTATTHLLQVGSSAGQSTGSDPGTAWHFIAVTRAGTAYRLYLDGSTTADISNTSTEGAGALVEVAILNNYTGATTTWCGCTMANIKFWNAVLSTSQLQNEMYSYRPRTTENLYGWWPTTSGSGSPTTDAIDYGGNGHSFTNGNADYVATTPPIVW